MHAATKDHATVAPLTVIRRMLAAVRRKARAWIWTESLALVAVAVMVGLWVTLIVDRLVEPPAWARVAMLAGVMLAAAWLIATKLVARLAVPLGDESLALLVERAYPETFGDALSTAVSCSGRSDETVDPAMVATTLAAAAERVGQVNSSAIFRSGRLAGITAAALAAMALTLTAVVIRPVDAATWGRRMVGMSDEPWPRRIGLEPIGFVDGRRVVARGDDVEVLVRAVPARGAPPELVELRTRAEAGWRTDRMGARGGVTAEGQVFGHLVEGVGQDLDLEIRGGDGRLRGLRIVVKEPPAIESLTITSTPPAYLGGGPRTVAASRIVAVPRGSIIDLACTATKPLSHASIAIRRGGAVASVGGEERGGEPLEELLSEWSDAGHDIPTIHARTPPIDADTVVLVRLLDRDGLANREPVAVVLAAVADEPPRVAVRLAGISTAVTPQAVLPIEGLISDDHALATAVVRMTIGEATRERPVAGGVAGRSVAEFPPDRPEVVPLAESGLVPGMRLSVCVVARDGCALGAGPNETAGDTWTLDVVTPEALQAMLEAREVLLRRRCEAMIDDLAKSREVAVSFGSGRGDAGLAGETADELIPARCGDAVSRATGEAGEIAAEFRGIHLELMQNGLATAELENRLVMQIAEPLAAIVRQELAVAGAACRQAAERTDGDHGPMIASLDRALARLRGVLARMIELESVNEVIERLRGVIRLQESIRADTLERQKRRGREALESP